MLNLKTGTVRTCEGIDRRAFLRIGGLGAFGVSLPVVLQRRHALAASSKLAREVNCVFIWTHGGTSHHDTLDPKPDAAVNVKGPFGAIPTAIPGVQFSEICPRLARELKRFAVLRSWNPQNGSHGIADVWCMSGRNFNPGMRYPAFGSVISHERGFKTALPPFVQLGEYMDRTFGGGTSGILGLEHSPFEIGSDPNAAQFAVRDITPPQGMALARVDRRKGMLATVDALQRKADLQPVAFDAIDEYTKAAFNMITAPETKRAFAIESEDPKLRDRYGRNRFGQSLLLARRLIESGVRFVTVTDPGWDNHQDCFNALKNNRMPPIDRALPEFLIDLDCRGLLDTTLVVWMTDFGRTPKINSASGRDHWATAGFCVMAGCGVPGGAVLGATDAQGERPIRNEYRTDDIAATIYHKLGLPLDLMAHSPDGRPVRLIEGNPIREWV
jgi:uncharacterized protein (DUF1501 family)